MSLKYWKRKSFKPGFRTITANAVTYGEELFEAILYAALVDSEQSSGNLVYCFSQTVNVVAVTLKDLFKS